MRRPHRPRLAVATLAMSTALASTLLVGSAPEPATADGPPADAPAGPAADRFTAAVTLSDPVGDPIRQGAASAQQAGAWDVTSVSTRERLDRDGQVSVEVVLGVANPDFAVDAIRPSATLTVTSAKRTYTAVVATDMHAGTVTPALSVDGAAAACPGLTSYLDSGNNLVLSVPLACLPGPGSTRIAARLVTITRGQTGQTDDATVTAAGAPVGYSPFRTSVVTDAPGDVDLGDRAGDDRGAGRSGDLLDLSVRYLPAVASLRVTGQVLDLSTHRYDPAQQFGLDLLDRNGTVVGHLDVTPDYSAAHQHVVSATGLDCPQATVSRLDARRDAIAIDVPRACLPADQHAVRVVLGDLTRDPAGQVLGTDTTTASDSVALR